MYVALVVDDQTDLALPYGLFAIALYAADTTYPNHRLSINELTRHAKCGTRILGGPDRVRELHAAWVGLNSRLLARQLDDDTYAREMLNWLSGIRPGVTPDPRRLERCIGLDHARFTERRLTNAGAQKRGHPAPRC
jgi:hypothetical protein